MIIGFVYYMWAFKAYWATKRRAETVGSAITTGCLRARQQARPTTNNNDKSGLRTARGTKINSSDPPLTTVRTACASQPGDRRSASQLSEAVSLGSRAGLAYARPLTIQSGSFGPIPETARQSKIDARRRGGPRRADPAAGCSATAA